ncbi:MULTISPECIES: response regulator [unclassified Pseudomonas]|uniref:response regulator n=1 Tax=unclassified Pseudomonas TaxID=196821 RepID=UPI002449FB1D|nr:MULTISPECIES: response regulator [unclassified Pseudomonas]MDG9931206.1 response regulator [Pseudomonas sp. GD04042]MDH0485784.1 response regulator [Pseudomonas sp. GD04015]MDH0607087.1 response regulator [Pseudomonas sp. GD03869]
MRFFSNLNLTGKIVTLVALLGALSIIITLYSMHHLYSVDRDYRALIGRDAQASVLIGSALLDLSDASRLVFSVLTEQEEAKMRATQLRLNERQAQFREKIAGIAPLLDDSAPKLEAILAQEQQVFELAGQIIDAAARWRGDRALDIIHSRFDPRLNELRGNMDALRDEIIEHFQSASLQLNAATRSTLLATAISFGLALTTIIGMSAYLSLTQISRPINQLTRTMGQLSHRHYDERIEHTERRDEVGRMAQALQVFRDNMQRADRLELEARASEEIRRISRQLVELTDAMPGAVFQLMVRPDGSQRFTFLSGKAGKFIGQETLVNSSGLRLDGIRVERSAAADQAIEQAIARSLEALQPLDIDMQVALDDRRFWLKTLATARRTDDGSTLFNGIWLDISDIKEQARALEEAKELAEQAAKAKAAFLATMSHEIRTPMNAILGLALLALRHPLEPRQQGRLEKILRAGQHLLGIINDILDYSKIDAEHLQVEAIPFSPRQLLEDVREMFEERSASKGLELRIEAPDELPLLVGDPLRVSQILINYVNNALKFSDRGRVTLRLRLEREDGLVLHGEVEDQGIGLSEQETRSLFQPFQQADASITRRFGGTGLGLAISRSLAELMGGGVGVRSRSGEGSVFWFRIRVAEAALGEQARNLPVAYPRVSAKALNGLRLLLVDDNELNRLVANELLKEAGMQVDQAEDGRHAIDLLEQAHDGTYDAVLMDLMMPEMDGLTATRLLRQNPRFGSLPIIAMTANASQQDIEQCLAAGMNAHVGKPIDEQQLWRTLLQHCLHEEPVQVVPAAAAPVEPVRQGRVLDPKPLEHLQRLVAPERFTNMLNMLMEDCRQRGRSFAALAGQADLQPLDQQAHDLISTAGHAGLVQLADLGKAVRQALQRSDVAAARALALQVDRAAADAVRELETRFGVAG